MPQLFFWNILNVMGLIYRQIILQATYSPLAPLKSMAKCPFISEGADFSLIDLNNRPGPSVKPEFNNYYYFKLSWCLLQAQKTCHVGSISAVGKHRPNISVRWQSLLFQVGLFKAVGECLLVHHIHHTYILE